MMEIYYVCETCLEVLTGFKANLKGSIDVTLNTVELMKENQRKSTVGSTARITYNQASFLC